MKVQSITILIRNTISCLDTYVYRLQPSKVPLCDSGAPQLFELAIFKPGAHLPAAGTWFLEITSMWSCMCVYIPGAINN